MDSGLFRENEFELDGLYLAWSEAETFRGVESALLSWFVARRPGPSARAAHLVRDYQEVGDLRRRILDRYVGELFTGGELALFRESLRQSHGLTVFARRVRTPIDPRVNPTGLVPATLGLGLTTLPKSRDFPLPFEVWAYRQAARKEKTPPLAKPLDAAAAKWRH